MRRSKTILLLFLISRLAVAQSFYENSKLLSSDRNVMQQFGYSVSLSGKNMLIGSFASAYLLEEQSQGVWKHLRRVNNPDLNGGGFGQRVRVQGNFAFISAHHVDLTSGGETFVDAGAVYVFEKDPLAGWQYRQRLNAERISASSFFGQAIAAQDNIVAIGAFREEDIGDTEWDVPDAGSVYIFQRKDTGWELMQNVIAPDRTESDNFGISVAIHANTMIVGAASDNRTTHSGSVYFFERGADGKFAFHQKLFLASSPITGFGLAVQLFGDYALVANDGAERVHVLRRIDGIWTVSDALMASGQSPSNLYGRSLALTDTLALVGASFQDDLDHGTVYFFARDATGKWVQKQQIFPRLAAVGDEFGASISLDGSRLLVGSYLEERDENGANRLTRAGAAYVFSYQAKNPELVRPDLPVVEPCDPLQTPETLPNVVTPNGDGYNDRWMIDVHDHTSLTITDRYGKIIFESKEFMNDWDADDLSAGVYFYRMLQSKGRCSGEYKGWIQVLK